MGNRLPPTGKNVDPKEAKEKKKEALQRKI